MSRSWAQQANPEEREANRAALSNLQAKVDYLKNPRHVPPTRGAEHTLIKPKRRPPKEIGIKPKLEKER